MPPTDDVVALFEARTYGGNGGEALPYRLLRPAVVEAEHRSPLVLFLHGGGERGDDNTAQLLYLPELLAKVENQQRYPCFVLAPQCPTTRRWVEVDWSASRSTAFGDPSPVMQSLIQVLKQTLAEEPVDPNRVYLTGLSMGGYGAWDLAMRVPELLAALVPICGGGDESQAARLAKLPTWAVHGAEDPAVPVDRSRRMVEAIRRAGGQPHYTELAGVGHHSWMPAYTDPEGPLPWMFRQSRTAE